MRSRILVWVCLVISAACQLAGYISAGYWQITLLILAMLIFWLFTRTKPGNRPIYAILVGYLTLSVIGIWLGLAPVLLVTGCTSALAAWDLVLFIKEDDRKSVQRVAYPLERWHLIALVVSAGLGLLLAIFCLVLQIRLTFAVIAGLTLLAGVGIYLVFRSLSKSQGLQ